ncbi:hypothetical protein ATANTOWER_021487 [Ataeniobius toweri]|uniref:Uncharacterized protein n=1 Tax=Ataeniobius toweri TaxID=208326 RepID=A0ABU7CKB5_9TELE|nr:hypothetical protein [Ataeniobius toweri]
MEEIRATDIQRASQSMGTPGGPPPGLQKPPQRRAKESPRGNSPQPQCRSTRELQQRPHRHHQQPSMLEQIQPWTQRPETQGTPPQNRGQTLTITHYHPHAYI